MPAVALASEHVNSQVDPGSITRLPPLRSMFWRPNYLADSAWIEHLPFAFWLIEAHRPRVLVELGTHTGVSYFGFCQAVERLGLDTQCYAVDTWKGDEHAGYYGEEVFSEVRSYNENHYSTFSRLVRSSFDDAMHYFSEDSIDLLHIDGLHTLDAVSRDFENWLPKLSQRAVVIFHDTNVRERNFGVFKLFERLRKKYPAFEFLHGHGLGVLGVGQHQSEALAKLFAADVDPPSRQSTHEVFGRLGRACADARAIADREAISKSLQKQLASAQKQTGDLKNALDQKQVELDKRTFEFKQELERLNSLGNSKKVEHELVAERSRNAEERVAELRSQLAAIVASTDAENVQSAAVTGLRADLESANSRLRELEAVEAENARLGQALEARDAELQAIATAREIERQLSRKSLEEANVERKRLEAEKESLTAADDEKARLLDETSKGFALASDRLKAITFSRNTLRQRLALRGKQAAAAARRQATLSLQLDALQTELSLARNLVALSTTITNERDALTVKLAMREQDSSRARLCGKEYSAEATRREAEIIGQPQELVVSTARVDGGNATRATMVTERESLAVGLGNRDVDLKLAEQQSRELLSENARLERDIAERFRELADITRLLVDHKMELQLRVAQADGLRRQMEEMHRRYTWRANSPWRAAFDALGGARSRAKRLITASKLFDAGYYRACNPDVAMSGYEPLEHFIKFGGKEGRNPSAHFSVQKYLALYPDVYHEGFNALAHYVEFGCVEGRKAPNV